MRNWTKMAVVEGSEGLDKWRYAVALAKFMVHVLHPGIPKSLSVLIPSLVYQLDLDYTTVGFFITLEAGVMFLACPISNYLSQRFNSRLVATVGGLLASVSLMAAFFSQTATSLGCSFFFTGFFASPLRQISDETLRQHFKEGFGFVATVTHVGSQIGSFILPYLTVICLDAYGMRGALLLLGALMFHGVPTGATMRPPLPHSRSGPKSNSLNSKNDDDHELELLENQSHVDDCKSSENSSNDDMDLKTKAYLSSSRATLKAKKSGEETNCAQFIWNAIRDFISSTISSSFVKNERVFMFLLLPCQALFSVSYGNWAFFSVSYGVSVGMSEERAVYLLMMGSVGGIIGRFVLIAVLYKHPLLAPHMFAINTAIASLALLAYPFNSSLTYLMICSLVSGFGFYSCFSCYIAAVSLKVQKTNFYKAVSYSLMTDGISILFSGILSGFLYDLFGSYPVIFRIMGILMGVVSVTFTVFICVEPRKSERIYR